MIAHEPSDGIGSVAPAADGGIARTKARFRGRLGVDFNGEFQFDGGIALGFFDLLGGELSVGDGIEAFDSMGDIIIGDAFHFEGMEAAKLGDLFKSQACVIDQPDRGGGWHEGFFIHDGLALRFFLRLFCFRSEVELFVASIKFAQLAAAIGEMLAAFGPSGVDSGVNIEGELVAGFAVGGSCREAAFISQHDGDFVVIRMDVFFHIFAYIFFMRVSLRAEAH